MPACGTWSLFAGAGPRTIFGMHHKRRRAKAARAGCLLCKPNKVSGWPPHELGKTGYGKLRRERLATLDLLQFNLAEAGTP